MLFNFFDGNWYFFKGCLVKIFAENVVMGNSVQIGPEFPAKSLRASSYELGNRAGPVTRTNFVVCSYGKFQPGYRDEKESKRARNVDWGPGNEFEHA